MQCELSVQTAFINVIELGANHRISRHRMRASSRHRRSIFQKNYPYKSAILNLPILFKTNYSVTKII